MSEPIDIDQLLSRIREETGRLKASQMPPLSPTAELDQLLEAAGQILAPDGCRLADFYQSDDPSFLRLAYSCILGRAPDESGLQTYLQALRQGELTRLAILVVLLASDEARQRHASLPEIQPWIRLHALVRLARLPGIGQAFRVLWRLLDAWQARRALSPAKTIPLLAQENRSQAQLMHSLLRLIDQRQQVADRTMEEARQTVIALRQDLILHQHALRQLMQEWRRPEASPSGVSEAHENDALHAYYLAFENAYRGSEDAITAAQAAYLPDIRDSAARRLPVLDIGCGRGEWLTLLNEHGYQVRGLDLNPAMVDCCRDKGLEVAARDALAYLREQPDNSLGAITGFHIVEHVPFPRVFDLFGEALRVLAPGGKLILETPNPENVVVGASAFYNDPTHLNPLPPRPLEFLARYHGFEPVEIRRMHPYPMEQHLKGEGEVENFLNYHFHGPQDYAVIATKPGAA